MDSYNSSEEIQRQQAEVFARRQKKAAPASETQKLKKVLDAYIAKHSSTVAVRALAKERDKTAEHQLDVSADIVEILTKIKSELR